MTTIVTDGNIIVADSGISHGSTAISWGVEKIRIEKERIYAFSGLTATFAAWVEWYESGANPRLAPKHGESANDSSSLWVFEGNRLIEISSTVPYPMTIGVPSAMGSGERYAYGVLSLGLAPELALKAAMNCDPHTFGDMAKVELGDKFRVDSQAFYRTWLVRDKSSAEPVALAVV